MSARVCTECGADSWQSRAFERLNRRNVELQTDVERLARENGLLRWRVEDAKAQGVSELGSLQRKVRRQARVIVRLEKRLRAAGQRPYEGAELNETAPGAAHDAALAEREGQG